MAMPFRKITASEEAPAAEAAAPAADGRPSPAAAAAPFAGVNS